MNVLKINLDDAQAIALAMYKGEPCRICGYKIGDFDAVYAGYSKDNLARSAHTVCWNSNVPRKNWKYPEDSND
jgi:hypothetical protein